MKSNSIIKFLLVLVISIFSLAVLKDIFFPTGYGIGVNISGSFPGGHMYINRSYSYGFDGTLIFIIKLLFIALTVSLILGIVFYVKNNVFTNEDIETIKNKFASNKQKSYENCAQCGKELDPEWKVCPNCGQSND